MLFSNPLLTLLIAATSYTQLASCKPAPIVGGRPSRGGSGPNPDYPDQAASHLHPVGEVPPLGGTGDVRIAPGGPPEISGSSQGLTSGNNGSSSGAGSFALAQAQEGGNPAGNPAAFSAAFSNGGQNPSAGSFAFSGFPVEFFNGGGNGFFNVAFG
ncbi:nucleoporin NUP42-like [Palaemon carinicauda]|uniref:nucleoporin NUP42-like n=1 Tax=Palaemon carinicauda TaxID=392227 RepID=UPI0035B5FC46